MKNLLLFCLSLFVSVLTFAQSAEIKHVKNMYGIGVHQNKTNIYNELSGNEILSSYSDKKIQSLFKRDNAYAEREQGLGCIDYVILWQGQDYDPKAKLIFTQPSKDKVKVKIGATKYFKERYVTYQVQCKGSNCQIVEIYEKGKPLTTWLSKCLDEWYITD